MRLLLTVFVTVGCLAVQVNAGSDCKNGGFALSDGKCNCPSFWTGKDCGTRLCMNGGGVKPGTQVCECPPGYKGLACDAVSASAPDSGLFPTQKSSFNIIFLNVLTDFYGRNTLTALQNVISKGDSDFNNSAEYNLVVGTAKYSIGQASDFDWTFNNFSSIDAFKKAINTTEWQRTQDYTCFDVIDFYSQALKLIRDRNLRRTHITFITQHPPKVNSSNYDELIYVAEAFKVQINVVFIEDNIFSKCDYTVQQFQDLWNLAHRTHGHAFTIAFGDDDVENPKILHRLLSLNGNYETMSISAFDSCSEAKADIYSDLQLDGSVDIITIAQSTNLDILNATLSSILATEQEHSSSIHGNLQLSWMTGSGIPNIPFATFVLSSTSSCVVTNYIRTSRHRPFASFVERSFLDSSNVAPEDGIPQYTTIHLEDSDASVIDVAWSNSTTKPVPATITKRPAAFEYITNETYSCDSQSNYNWLQLSFNDAAGSIHRRAVPFNCYKYNKTSSEEEANYVSSGEEHLFSYDTDTGLDPLPVCFSDSLSDKSTLFVGFSNLVQESVRQTLLLEFNSGNSAAYGLVMFDRKGEANPEADPALTPQFFKTTSDAQHAVQNIYKLNSTLSIQPFDTTNALDKLQTVLDAVNITENSALVYVLGRMPTKTQYQNFNSTKYYKQMINAGLKFIPLVSYDLLAGTNVGIKVVNDLAVVTQGHFISFDTSDIGQNLDGPLSQLLTDIYQKVASNHLFHSIDIENSAALPSLPNFDVEVESADVFVTASVEVQQGYGPGDTACAFLSVNVGGKTAVLQRYGNSNFYSGNTTVQKGSQPVRITTVCQNAVALHIRLYASDLLSLSVQYSDLKDDIVNYAVGPNQYYGMIARLAGPGSEDAGAHLKVLSCNGSQALRYDAVQTGVLSNTTNADCQNNYFAPYFCDPSYRCPSSYSYTGVQQVQFVVGGHQFTKSFYCDANGSPQDQNCNQPHTDNNGNTLCTTTSPTGPFYRGPTGDVFDCMGDGHLQYHNMSSEIKARSNYQCACDEGFMGLSCQQGFCPAPNQSPGALDTVPRTLSIVFCIPQGASGAILPGIMSPIIKVLGRQAPIDGIWLYQAFFRFSDGTDFVLYSGPEFEQFKKSYAALKLDPLGGHDIGFTLQDSFEMVTNALGKQTPGVAIVYFYNDQTTFMDVTTNDTEPEYLDRFYQMTQLYKQRFFVLSQYDNSAFMRNLGKTGGETISNSRNSIQENEARQDNQPLMMKAALATGGMYLSDLGETVFANFAEQVLSVVLSGSPLTTNFGAYLESPNTETYFTVEEVGNTTFVFSSNQSLAIAKLFQGECGAGTEVKLHTGHYGGYATLPNATAAKQYCFRVQGVPLVVSVYNSGGLGTVTDFVSKWNVDTHNAVPIENTSIGPTLAVHVPDGLTFSNEDFNARASQRINCTFQAATYSPKAINSGGLSTIQLDIKDSSLNTVATKAVPFAVTSSIDCANGGTFDPKVGACQCTDDYIGVDCTQPSGCTGSSGVLNTWKDTCNCPGRTADQCISPWTAF